MLTHFRLIGSLSYVDGHGVGSRSLSRNKIRADIITKEKEN
jgi:hypothetical protein